MGWGPGQGRPGSLGPRPVRDGWLFQDAQLGLAEPHVVSCGHLPCQRAARLRPWLRLLPPPHGNLTCLSGQGQPQSVGRGQPRAGQHCPQSRGLGQRGKVTATLQDWGWGAVGRAERRQGEKGQVRPTFAGSHGPRGGKHGSGAWRASLGPPVRELWSSSLLPLLPRGAAPALHTTGPGVRFTYLCVSSAFL